jgi:hypothetical protein
VAASCLCVVHRRGTCTWSRRRRTDRLPPGRLCRDRGSKMRGVRNGAV